MNKFSPKLKRAMLQIKNILDAEDIAGIVVLHTPGFSEFLNKVNPSYSCIIPTQKPHPVSGEMQQGFHIKATVAELGKEKQKQVLEDTANMLVHLNDIGGGIIYQNIKVQELFETKIEIEKKDGGGLSSHESQNN